MSKLVVSIPNLNECKSYEAFKRELQTWSTVTEIGKKKQGNVVALSLPNKSEFGDDIKEKVLDNFATADLQVDDGLDKLIEFLDQELGKDATDSAIEKWDAFDDCRKKDHQSLEEFLNEFETKRKRVETTGSKFPPEILGYMLMKRAGLSRLERALILSKVSIADKTNFYKNVKSSMKNILGACMKGDTTELERNVFKQEPVFYTQEEVHATNGFYNKGKPSYGKYNNGKSYKKFANKWERKDRSGRPINAKDQDGKYLTCNECGSFRHLYRDCTYKKTDNQKGQVLATEESQSHDESCNVTESMSNQFEVERFVLFTTDQEEISKFTSETINPISAALDSCCTSTVAGEKYLEIYLASLSNDLRKKVKGPYPGKKWFQFGNEGRLQSIAKYSLPAVIAGNVTMIDVDIIKSDIPMLLSKDEMKKHISALILCKDQAEIAGKIVDLGTTSAGHYLLPLLEQGSLEDNLDVLRIEEVLAIDLLNANDEERFKALEKLHAQFGHRPKESFINVLKSADCWKPEFMSDVDKILSGCEGCIKRRRNSPRPVVAMPMASAFNQKVAIDLKLWKGKHILYMIDMWSRLTVATVIKRKFPTEVIDAIMEKWVAYFGVPGAILNDNGGEFTAMEVREAKNVLNIDDDTTGAHSPWQNGLCEKNHALADNILDRIDEDNPNMNLTTKLAWVCMAKNSLQMVFGYSPNQLVYGVNPKLPNILSDGPPSWEPSSMSQALNKHLKVLHETRKEFIKSEACQKLKLALKSKIRTSSETYEYGDVVYYKRDHGEKWFGPGRVMFQDGKVIFVRQGAYFVRVSANRITKVGEELRKKLIHANKCGINQWDDRKGLDLSKDQNRGLDLTKDPNKNLDQSKDINVERDLSKDLYDILDLSKDLNTKLDLSKDPDCNKDLSKDLPGLDLSMGPRDNLNDLSKDHSRILDDLSKDQSQDISKDPSDEDNDVVSDEDNINKRKASSPLQPERIPKVLNRDKILLRKDDKIKFKEDGDWVEATITGRGKVTGKHKNWFNVRRADGGEDHSVNLEEMEYEMMNPDEVEMVLAVTLPKNKIQQNAEACILAKVAELDKLKSFDTYETVEDDGQPRISCTWVVGMKGDEVRARLVARGFEETEEVPKDSPTMAKSSLRLILAIASAKGWNVETTDIKSAFLQGSHLERDVYLKPPKEANQRGKLWKLKKCLYGLRDASRQFYIKVKGQLVSLDFIPSDLDPGIFYLHDKDGNLVGLIGIHVDDFIHAGNEMFTLSIIPKVMEIFNVGKNEKGTFMYTGYKIVQTDQGITLDQDKFVENIEINPMEASRKLKKDDKLTSEESSELRKICGTVNWAASATRPDLAYEMVDLSTKFNKGSVEDIIRAHKALLSLKNSQAKVFLPKIENIDRPTLVCYTDAALGTLNNGVDSSCGYVIFLADAKDNCAVLDWKSNKIKRVVRSTLAAETLSLCDGLEAAIYLAGLIEDLLGLKTGTVRVEARTDNKSAVETIKSSTAVKDKRLNREIGAIKQMIRRNEVHQIRWLPGKDQLADVLTKRGVNGSSLLQVLQTGKFF
jgi:hypothetical protein